MLKRTYLVTTPITAIGCRQCLPLSVVQLKGKHCRKPHCRNGVVDTIRYVPAVPAFISAKIGDGENCPLAPLVPPALKLIPRSWCRKTSSKVADRILKKVPIWFRYVTSDQVRSKINCSLNFPLMYLHKYF